MIQPVLVPCKRSCDLFASLSRDDPGMLRLYWGTALLQRVPLDRSHPLLRLTAGLLYNLRFPVRNLAACLPFCEKTIRALGLALRDCSTPELMRTILGERDDEALTPDQKQYVRVRYRELRPTCRLYRQTILAELWKIWKIAPCGEVLRRCFREADAKEVAEVADEQNGPSFSEPPAPARPERSVSVAGNAARTSAVDSEMEKGKSGCASRGAASTRSRNAGSVFGRNVPPSGPTCSECSTELSIAVKLNALFFCL